MEQDNIEILKNIKKVETPDWMYKKVVDRIQQRKAQMIPLYKVGIAASLIFILVASEVVLVNSRHKKTQKVKEVEQLISLNNNSLYYE